MFLPTTQKEIRELGWDRPDIILITGDTYIDSPFIGIALIGKVLASHGFKVAIIAQPNVKNGDDISRLGEPRLFWGVSGGSVDSMVANYTASGKRRKRDDYTPGGSNNLRPDRAVIAYCNLIRRYFKKTVPIVLGGIEASLRRIAHYDFTSRSIRRSILFDARADYICFGMAHESIVLLAKSIQLGECNEIQKIRGLGYIGKPNDMVFPTAHLPAFEIVCSDRIKFIESFRLFYDNCDPHTAVGLCQNYGDRWLLLNPPPPVSDTTTLDSLHELDYERAVHPFYAKGGVVRALETIRFSIPTHYGCYGECNFCAIAVHQGREVTCRSADSIVREAEKIVGHEHFKGYITDLGGATANMYGYECSKKQQKGSCRHKRCLFPRVCSSLRPTHRRQLELLRRIETIPQIKKVFIASGIRHDLILADRQYGEKYLRKICSDNISGQLKLAPEHSSKNVLKLMGKSNCDLLLEFKKRFDNFSAESKRKQFLTYYFIAAHPGCSPKEMEEARRFCQNTLRILPEQVQIFTPTPSTWSTVMYYTGCDPFSNNSEIFIERDTKAKERQKQLLLFQTKNKNKRRK